MRKLLLAGVLVAAVAAGPALEAQAQIRLNNERQEFSFHGRLGPYPGKAAVTQGVVIEAWAWSADGSVQTERIISVGIPAGACVDRGASCRFIDRNALLAKQGVYKLRMKFSTGKIWMKSYGDVSKATPKMTVYVTFPGPTPSTYSITANFRDTKKGWLLPDNDPQW
jgi:hypothetical protein